jgi:hypothetical protein
VLEVVKREYVHDARATKWEGSKLCLDKKT